MEKNTLVELNELLDTMLELPPEERGRWVDELGPEFEPVKLRLHALLEHSARVETDDFLGTLPKVDGVLPADPQASEQAGTEIGPYRLLRELGVGGMGTVWLAERSDGLIKRPVALKLPRGAWQLTGLAERMAREREILATLNHPNIARLYDAGLTSEGQPYLALEYIEGKAIDAYCEEHRLSTKARLGLFLQAAEAIAYAHGQLVVHRDLKPANILVTEKGDVRLLDFGIAKLLEQGEAKETVLTEFAGRALTPDYASPEQIAGQPITIASDVYSLGVLLYELLTGERPYKLTRDTRGALEDAILDTEPARPSEVVKEPSLRKALRGDLDTVTLKALKKVPKERYATVNALAEDLQRHLSSRPLLAKPDSTWYSASKFVGRNKLAVSAAAAVLVAILAGAGVALWQAQLALTEKDRAEEVKEFIASIFRNADPYAGEGEVLSAVDLLNQAKESVDETFEDRPALRVELLNLIGGSLLRLQEVDAGEQVLAAASEEAVRSLGPEHPEALRTRLLQVSVYRWRGNTERMREELAELMPILRKHPGANTVEIVGALKDHAHAAMDEMAYEEAVGNAREAMEFAMAKLGPDHPETAGTMVVLAQAHLFNENAELAVEAAEQAHGLALAIHNGNGKHPLVINTRKVYSQALGEAGQVERAIVELTQARDDAAQVLGANSREVAFFSQNLVNYELERGYIQDALANAERAFVIQTEMVEPGSFTHGAGLSARGKCLLSARRPEEAAKDLSGAAEVATQLVGATHHVTLRTRVNLALALIYAGNFGAAEEMLQEVLAAYRSMENGQSSAPLHVLGVLRRMNNEHTGAIRLQKESLDLMAEGASGGVETRRYALTEIGLSQVELGEFSKALETLGQALELYEQHESVVTPQRADALVGMGRANIGLGQAGDALPALEEANAFWSDFDPDNRWAGEAALWLGRAYLIFGRKVEANEALSRAERLLSESAIPGDAELVKLARQR